VALSTAKDYEFRRGIVFFDKLLADGFVVNFYARYEKGVKTEYIDPIVTMQLLGLAELSTAEPAIEPGLYVMREKLSREEIQAFWSGLDESCRPLSFSG
jgi:hypothetical protein